jgi:DNA replication protein DnaC
MVLRPAPRRMAGPRALIKISRTPKGTTTEGNKMDSFGEIIRGKLRHYFVGRYQELHNRSVKDLLQEVTADDLVARHEIVRGLVGHLANAPEDSARLAHIQRMNELDGVSWLCQVDPGIPAAERTLEAFKARQEWPDVALARASVETWLRRAGTGLLSLIGPVGCGKTHLAIAAAQDLFAREQAVVYREEAELVGELQNRMRDNTTEAALQEIMDVPWLIIDDLGLTALGEWGKSTMDRLINARWENSATKRTLITTNLLPREMSPRIASRLNDTESSKVVVVKATDFRHHGGDSAS